MLKKLFVISMLFLLSCNQDETKTKPSIVSLTESVYSSVTVQPENLYEANAAVSGILGQNLVEEGDTVKVGTPILQIINNTPLLNTENARLALDLAKKNYAGNAPLLKELQDEIATAKLKCTNDSINYTRQKNLWEKQVGSKNEYDTKKLNYETSKNQLNLLKSKYSRTRNELEIKLRQAENNYKTAQINTGDHTVTSKVDGIVYELIKNPGENVSSQEPIATLGSAHNFIIEMLVDEVDIVKISMGQKILITLDAYGDNTFEATVSKIYPKMDQRSQTFKVEGVFAAPPKTLYPGLSGEANIIIRKKENIVAIPINYLKDNNQVETENGPVQVKTGIKDMEMVEILSGLDSSTYIYKP